jgi:hypothetical protein
MPIETVKQLCRVSSLVESDSLVDQVAQLESSTFKSINAEIFFKQNYFTAGLDLLLKRSFERLAGRSADGAFYLTQAMGGGKTHSLIALGLLAQDPQLRQRVAPNVKSGRDFGSARVVIFNGHQNPDSLLWGYIADQLGRPEVMAPFWKSGARTPGVNEWVSLLGDEPILILLDELPSYLQMAQGEPVGNSTLGDLTIGALERLFNALPHAPKACVVVTNLKDDVYLDGSGQLRTLIENLTKHYDRNAQAITPVQQNSGEVFAIARKRLFEELPSESKIDEVAQSFVNVLQKAKRIDTIATTPETFIDRIRETYPFHPSIRDIVARFSENRGYQKTRALIRLLRLAVRGAYASNENAFLIGLQHLDFNDSSTLEELRKINPSYSNAISRDIADRGNALSERIDSADGTVTASSVAKLLLMSSLSAAESPLRGLTDGELIESLVDPLLEVSEIKTSLTRLQGQAWYLFQGIDSRIFFGQTSNVTAEVTEIAANIAEEHVDQTLRLKLEEVFKPKSRALYADQMAILPALDNIKLDEDRPVLVILERPPDKLPKDFSDWWNQQEFQNRVLVLTADPNAVNTLRTSARRIRAIEKVEERIRVQHGPSSMQMQELQIVKDRETAGFTSALRETFKTIVFPTGNSLRLVEDFRMEFDRNDYSGEQQIIETLSKRGKYIASDIFDSEFENVRLEAEELLFDAKAVQLSALRRNAAVRGGWFWLPRAGFDQLVKTSVQRGFWLERDGLIAKAWDRTTKVIARLEDSGPNPMATGRFLLSVVAEDADLIYYSENGLPDIESDKKLSGRIYETEAEAVWFMAVDSSGLAITGDAIEWRAPIRAALDVKRVSGGYKATLAVTPRSARVRATFDGSDPRIGQVVPLEFDIPPEASRLRVIPEVNSQFGPEETAVLLRPLDGDGGENDKPKLDFESKASMVTRFEPTDTAAGFSALDRLSKIVGASIVGGYVEVNGERLTGDYLTLRLGENVKISSGNLDSLVKLLVAELGAPAPTLKLRLDRIDFASGRDLSSFCDAVGEDFDRVKWSQD